MAANSIASIICALIKQNKSNEEIASALAARADCARFAKALANKSAYFGYYRVKLKKNAALHSAQAQLAAAQQQQRSAQLAKELAALKLNEEQLKAVMALQAKIFAS